MPWEPIPGRGRIEIKSTIKIQENYGDVELREPEIRAEPIRRMRITKQDLVNYEMTTGCPGRIAANRGVKGVNHTERCRKRIEGEIQKKEPQRIDNSVARMMEKQLRQEEEKKEKEEEEKTKDKKRRIDKPEEKAPAQTRP